MINKDLYIIGAGTYGEVMYELATINKYKVIGYFDEDENKQNTIVMDAKVLGKFSMFDKTKIKGKQFIVAVGNNKKRNEIMTEINRLGGITPTLIHPSSVVSESAAIGKGVYIQANCNIWTKAKISDFCIVSPNVVIAHHTTIGESCLISTLTGVGASITIEDNVFIGMGSTIMTGISRIGKDSVIGAGAVVIKDVESNSVYAGVPAKKIRDL